MRRFAVVLALLCFGFSGRADAQVMLGSTMKFEQETWDFGTIREEAGPVSHTFEFTNTGKTPFVIENVVTTCGCTTPEYTKAPVRPSQKGSIEITYNPLGRPGKFRKEITVMSNNRANRNVLVITGDVLPRPQNVNDEFPVQVGDGLQVGRTTVGLGYVPRGTTKSTTLEYYNNSKRDVSLEVVYDRPNAYFSVTPSVPVLKPRTKGLLTITYDMRRADEWGRLTNTFGLKVNGIDSNTEFSATGIVTENFPELSADEMKEAPRAVFDLQYYNFDNVKAGDSESFEFSLTNEGKKPLILRSAAPSQRMSTTLRAGTSVAPGETVKFRVTLKTAGAPKGKLMETMVLIFNDPLRPMREIRLGANVI